MNLQGTQCTAVVLVWIKVNTFAEDPFYQFNFEFKFNWQNYFTLSAVAGQLKGETKQKIILLLQQQETNILDSRFAKIRIFNNMWILAAFSQLVPGDKGRMMEVSGPSFLQSTLSPWSVCLIKKTKKNKKYKKTKSQKEKRHKEKKKTKKKKTKTKRPSFLQSILKITNT